jgi:hypothetical protein
MTEKKISPSQKALKVRARAKAKKPNLSGRKLEISTALA